MALRFKRGVKHLTRFAYFSIAFPGDSPEVGEAAHLELERVFHKKFTSGDTDAIFRYAQDDNWCFRSDWVIRQIERWKVESSTSSLKNLSRLFTCYTGLRGKRTTTTLINTIERDQKIFKSILMRKSGIKIEDAIRGNAGRFHVSERLAKQVWTEYKYKMDHYAQQLKLPSAANPDPTIFRNRRMTNVRFLKFAAKKLHQLTANLKYTE